eukprot:gnl/Spiro4/618_TR352_c0_g1_i1.p1 gnl/Spiro4/618_TR352_c0_g1~~gnl/Spiro4/618_TR352_c0_g1_i1.p1  ORF type:complete len:625 (-),score=123.75 gnl/Spiro4/618_TR352_c0_g1_i1:72-1907(-)
MAFRTAQPSGVSELQALNDQINNFDRYNVQTSRSPLRQSVPPPSYNSYNQQSYYPSGSGFNLSSSRDFSSAPLNPFSPSSHSHSQRTAATSTTRGVGGAAPPPQPPAHLSSSLGAHSNNNNNNYNNMYANQTPTAGGPSAQNSMYSGAVAGGASQLDGENQEYVNTREPRDGAQGTILAALRVLQDKIRSLETERAQCKERLEQAKLESTHYQQAHNQALEQVEALRAKHQHLSVLEQQHAAQVERDMKARLAQREAELSSRLRAQEEALSQERSTITDALVCTQDQMRNLERELRQIESIARQRELDKERAQMRIAELENTMQNQQSLIGNLSSDHKSKAHAVAELAPESKPRTRRLKRRAQTVHERLHRNAHGCCLARQAAVLPQPLPERKNSAFGTSAARFPSHAPWQSCHHSAANLHCLKCCPIPNPPKPFRRSAATELRPKTSYPVHPAVPGGRRPASCLTPMCTSSSAATAVSALNAGVPVPKKKLKRFANGKKQKQNRKQCPCSSAADGDGGMEADAFITPPLVATEATGSSSARDLNGLIVSLSEEYNVMAQEYQKLLDAQNNGGQLRTEVRLDAWLSEVVKKLDRKAAQLRSLKALQRQQQQ